MWSISRSRKTGDLADAAQFEVTMKRAVNDAVTSRPKPASISQHGEMRARSATQLTSGTAADGFEGDSPRPTPQDLDDYPEYRDRLVKAGHSATYRRPVCKGPIAVKSPNQSSGYRKHEGSLVEG
jgi:5-methyltetrahydropteroyltriglutamate--homocysteine methyltransferase